jgi:hypothetical protein
MQKPDGGREGDAFGNLMASQGAKVRVTGKPPLILQVCGRSARPRLLTLTSSLLLPH